MTESQAALRLAPQSPAQHKSALWANPELRIYAIVMGSRIPDLPARLAVAEVQDQDCLLPGALEPEQRPRAPYIAELRYQSPFTDWLLFEAPQTLGEWGVIARSSTALTQLRNHLREHLRARLPSGAQIGLDWMDPEILTALIEHADPASLAALFGPVSSFTITGRQDWRHASMTLGALQRTETPLVRST